MKISCSIFKLNKSKAFTSDRIAQRLKLKFTEKLRFLILNGMVLIKIFNTQLNKFQKYLLYVFMYIVT